MPTITISDGTREVTLSGRAVAKLQPLVDRTNNGNNLSLDLLEWVKLYLCESAIGDELAAVNRIAQEREEAASKDRVQTAIRRRRAQLLAELESELTG